MTLLQLQQQQNAAEPTRITEFRGTTSAVRQPSSPAGHTDQAETKSDEQSYPLRHIYWQIIKPFLSPRRHCNSSLTKMGCCGGADVRVNGNAPTRAKLRCADEVQLLEQTWVAIRIAY